MMQRKEDRAKQRANDQSFIKAVSARMVAAIRRCLCCGVDFESTHAGNRMCQPCKRWDDRYDY